MFKEVTLWARVHELPIGLRTRNMGEKIAQKIRKLVAMDESLDSDGWATFLRMRMDIEVDKPLRRTIKIGGRGEGNKVLARISYDRLPTFCYFCGRLGHSEDECKYNEGDESTDVTKLQYGDWIRSSPLKKGSFIERKNSSSAKTNLFFEKLKEKQFDRNNHTEGGHTTGKIVAQKLTMEPAERGSRLEDDP